MFSVGKMVRGLVRRTWSISIGQRPMRVKRHISARLKALKPCVNLFWLSPFQGLLINRFRFIGRCPMLMIKGLRPYLPLPIRNVIETHNS